MAVALNTALFDWESSGADDSIFDEPLDETILVEEGDDSVEIVADGFTPRAYQLECVRKVLEEFKKGIMRTLVVMATGTGKSCCIARLAALTESNRKACLILVHRDELIRQLVKAVGRVGLPALIEKAEKDALPEFMVSGNIVIASVQSMQGDRLLRWEKDAFGMIIVDECHHILGKTYEAIIDHFNAPLVGFTATADRLDKKNVGRVFQSLAFEYNLRDAVSDGWLVKPMAYPIVTDPPIDISKLRTKTGDISDSEMEDVIMEQMNLIINAILDTNALQGKKTIAFTPLVESSKMFASAFNGVGISSDWVSGGRKDRSKVIEAHKANKFQVLFNCAVLTEGYDDEELENCLLLRATKSRSLYSQMVGRVTRPCQRIGKAEARILDLSYVSGKHKLITPVDLYDNSEIDDKVLDIAREFVKTGEESDIDRALERAESAFEMIEMIKIQRQQVQVKMMSFDPLGACEVLGIRNKPTYDFGDTKPATEKMVKALRANKIEAPDDMPFAVAKKLLDTCMARRKYGLATVRQIAAMIRGGMPPGQARRQSFEAASAWLDSARQNS